MIEFGKSLRSAREAKGYTPSQIAEMTHLKASVVEGLENEDFSMIAAPIYGRGFVKLYCEAVGLEAKPLVEEFMAIVNGDREVSIKERPIADEPPTKAAASVPPPEPAAAPIPSPAAPMPEPDLFNQDTLPPPEPAVSGPTPPPPAPKPLPEPLQPQLRSLSRYAAPVRERPIATEASPFNARIILLAGCALALLVVLVLGIRSLYHATTSDVPQDATPPAAAAETAAEEPAKEPAKAAPAAKAAPRAQQQKIPSLYID